MDKDIIRVNPVVEKGLNLLEVEKRIEKGLVNSTESNTRSIKSIVFFNVFTFFNMLFFGIAVWLISVGAYSDLVFMSVVLTNLSIGIFQEVKAKKAVDKLSLMSAPIAVVIRESKEKTIPIDKVVVDDIIKLTAGRQIPTDCILRKGSVEVNESMLTGESDLILKKLNAKLYAGSFVVSGSCYARVDKVGKDTYVNSLAKEGKVLKKPKSEMLSALNLLIKIVGLVILPLGYLSYINNTNLGLDYVDSVVKTAASVIGIIPAGLYLMTSVALAVSSVKLANKKTMVQNLYSIEMLARIDILCLDKTGTITDGTMSVTEFLPESSNNKSRKIISSMMYHLDDENETAKALRSYFGEEDYYDIIETLPFSSSRKYSAITIKSGTFILGAPDLILSSDKEFKKRIRSFTRKGKRVLALASTNGELNESGYTGQTTLEALVIIDDNIRSDAPETLDYFKASGVEIKVISGDNALTASAVAKKAGVENAHKYISLHKMTDEEVIEAAHKYTVFGRVVPEQKRLIIETLKSKTCQVAMTGDGVNDILALKASDCSIAFASGSEAALNVSDIVLMDSNFSSLPKVVKEGRRVINNIEKISSLFLMKTVYSILLVLLTLILNKPYPFRPIQMTLIETFVIGIPSFMLALESNKSKVTGKFIPKALAKALPGSIVVFVNVLLLYSFQDIVGLTDIEISTISAVTTLVAGLIMLYLFCQPFNAYRKLLVSSMLIASLACLLYLSDVFQVQIGQLSVSGILVLIVLIQGSIPVLLNLKKMKETTNNLYRKGSQYLEKIDLFAENE
ncbi:HAD-IC family P-type ATPase [Mycoplasmatota bacterium WC44]